MTEEDKKRIKELLKKILKGDKYAFELLYKEYYNTVFCFVISYVKNKELAEDITHDTFAKILEDGFKIPLFSNPAAYLFEIAKNKCNDYFRKNKQTINYIMYLKLASGGIQAITCERYCLNDNLDGLSDFEEKLFLLRYDLKYTVKEIAELVGVSERTLNRKYKEIKQKIRKNVENNK